MLYDKIKKITKRKGIPIYRIEEDCGFARGSMCKWNDASPSWDKVKKVADYLGTTVDELIE